MSELTKRSAKYFFIQGLKALAGMILIELVLVLEWTIMGTENGSLIEHISKEVIFLGACFNVVLNMMYSIYGPTWYDSLALSMGARRKDIFWGEIIKQLVLVLGNTGILLLVCITCSQQQLINFVLSVGVVAIVAGPLGLIIGHKMKKYGMFVAFFIVIIASVVGTTLALSGFGATFFETISGMGVLGILAISVIAFLLLEVLVNRVNQKSMVR